MNSLLDILFLTCGELRSTDSRIKEKHITYTESTLIPMEGLHWQNRTENCSSNLWRKKMRIKVLIEATIYL